jgi:hypothetical protein
MAKFFLGFKMSESQIHIQFEHNQALQGKKDILSMQMGSIKVLKNLREYKKSRLKELKLKIKLLNKIKELKSSITKINQSLPKVKIPEKFRNPDYIEEKIKEVHLPKRYSSDLELQLQEIQEKLKELQ